MRGGGSGGCDSCDGDGAGGSTTPPTLLYLTYLNLADVHEPWTKGDPELEIHVMGPQGIGGPGYSYACSGDRQSGMWHWDMNTHEWYGDLDGGEGDQPIAYISTLDSITTNYADTVPQGSRGFKVVIWEDDEMRCEVYSDQEVTDLMTQLFIGAVGSTVLSIHFPNPVTPMIAALYWVMGSWVGLNMVFIGDDDLVGHLITSEEYEQRSGQTIIRGYAVVRGSHSRVGVANMKFK